MVWSLFRSRLRRIAVVRRAWMIGGLLGIAGLLAVAGAPLLLGAAMVSPALALALALCCGWYPGSQQIERFHRRRWEPRRLRAVDKGWPRLRRRSPFIASRGPLLGISLAVRPPPA